MPPPNKKDKHSGDTRATGLIREHKHTESKWTKERRTDSWADMADIIKEYSDIMVNTKCQVRTLEENKVVLLVLSCELEITLE